MVSAVASITSWPWSFDWLKRSQWDSSEKEFIVWQERVDWKQALTHWSPVRASSRRDELIRVKRVADLIVGYNERIPSLLSDCSQRIINSKIDTEMHFILLRVERNEEWRRKAASSHSRSVRGMGETRKASRNESSFFFLTRPVRWNKIGAETLPVKSKLRTIILRVRRPSLWRENFW